MKSFYHFEVRWSRYWWFERVTLSEFGKSGEIQFWKVLVSLGRGVGFVDLKIHLYVGAFVAVDQHD